MIQFLWLAPLGFLVGAFGTLIGAGGGFIHAPVLVNILKYLIHIATTTSHNIIYIK